MTQIVFSLPKKDLQITRKYSQEMHWTLDQTTLLALNASRHEIKSQKISPKLSWKWMNLQDVSPEIQFQLHYFAGSGWIEVIVLKEHIGLKIEIAQISLRGGSFEAIDPENWSYELEENCSNYFNIRELKNALAQDEIVVTINLEYIVRRSGIENNNDLQSVKSLQELSSEVVLSCLSAQNAILFYDLFRRIGLDVHKNHVIKFITENWKEMISEHGMDHIRANYTLLTDCLDLLLKK
jgi:hypothetical protein